MATEHSNAALTLLDANSTPEAKQTAGTIISDYIKETYPKTTSADYRVMEYNILNDGTGWGWSKLTQYTGDEEASDLKAVNRVNLISAIVQGYQPDLLGLTECYENWYDQADIKNAFGEKYAVVCTELPDEIINDSRNTDSMKTKKYNRSVLAYNTDTFDFVEAEIVDIMGDGYRSTNFRVVTCVILKDKTTQNKIATPM